MATLTFGLTSGVVNGTRTFTLSDADVTRWINAYRVALNIPNATNAQVLAAWANDAVDRTKRIVKDIEGKAALPAEISVTES